MKSIIDSLLYASQLRIKYYKLVDQPISFFFESMLGKIFLYELVLSFVEIKVFKLVVVVKIYTLGG